VAEPVTSEQVAAYRPLCIKLARRFTGVGNAEFDDLEQEGMIAVWYLLGQGFPVSSTAVSNRMRDWVRKCKRQGIGGFLDEEVALSP